MTVRFAAPLALITALACGAVAQRDTFDRHRELAAALSALDKLEQVATSLRAHGLREAAGAVDGARPALTTTVDALRNQLGPPRLSLVTITSLLMDLHARESSGNATPEQLALLAECDTARARLTNRRDELYSESLSLDVRLEETAESLRAARINETDWVESTERTMFKLRRMHARLADLWVERLSIEVSPALAHYFRESLRDSTATHARIEKAILECKSVATARLSRTPDAATLRSFATRVLGLRDLLLYAPVDGRPTEGDELVRAILQIETTVPPAGLELRYRLPQTVDRDRVIDVFTRRLVALAIDPEHTRIVQAGQSDVVVTVANPRVDPTFVKRVLGQRGSILLAWEATREELEAAGLRVDVNTFTKEDRPVPLFANAADPRRPPNPEASPAFCYYPAEQPTHPRGTPTPGSIVAVEPDAQFREDDIATLELRTPEHDVVLSVALTRRQRVRFQRVTGARRGRQLCLIVNDRVVSSPVVNNALPGRAILPIFASGSTIRTLAASYAAGALPVAPELISERTIAPADTVDFSLPPRKGTTLRIERTLLERSKLPTGTELRTKRVDSIEHGITGVADGRVSRASLRYVASTVQPSRDGGKHVAPMPTPLTGKTVVLSWEGDKPKITLWGGDNPSSGGGESLASEWATNTIRPSAVRRPILPLGGGIRAIGESWSLDAAAALSALHGGRVETSGGASATARLVSIDETPAGYIARIDVRARLAVDEGTIEWRADVRYDVAHRVVVRCVAKGRGIAKGAKSWQSSATFELEATAKIISRPL